MTDRELLELAAKAAGIDADVSVFFAGGPRSWNPITDDGDALRLAVKLNLEIQRSRITDARLPVVSCHMLYEDVHEEDRWQWEFVGTDPYAATRRAIVRAAAQIGEKLK